MSATGNASLRGRGIRRWVSDAALRHMRWPLRLMDRGWWDRQWAVETDARSAFHLLPFGLMLGIVAVHGGGIRPSALVAVMLTAAVLGSAVVIVKPPIRALLVLTGSSLLGIAAASHEISRIETVVISGETTTRLQGKVLWRDEDERGRWRYLLSIEGTERPTLSRPPSRAEVSVTSRHEPLGVGATYRGLVRLRPPSGPTLPGGYDFARGTFFEGVGAQGFGLGAPEPAVTGEAPELTPAERLTALRLAISDRIRRTIGGAEGAVASAIITGERSGIPDDVDAWLRTTGLSHVLSISGLHMALVAGFMMVLVRSGLAALPALALRLSTKKIAAGAALAGSGFYWALSGMDVATTRSFVMIAIMLAAVMCDRAAITLRNVSIAATVILLTTPHALLTASFQMSFAATAAIVAAYGFHSRRRHDDDDERKRGFVAIALLSLAGIAATSCVAGLATGPYAAFHFQRTAPFGLIANMLTLPLFSFWIMPLALLSMIAMPFSADGPLLVLLGKGLSLVFWTARELAERVPDHASGLLTVPGLLVLSAALMTACFLSSALRLLAIPLALAGLAAAPDRAAPPDLLLFENGREAALIDENGSLQPLNKRPNSFVFGQWKRAFPQDAEPTDTVPGFTCERIQAADGKEADRPGKTKEQAFRYCTAVTRGGLKVAWTDDYRRTDQACDEADVAIVARAIRLETCRSGARLFTLRSLRRSGSIAIHKDPGDRSFRVVKAMPEALPEWNRHRLMPWPERWSRRENPDKS